jgi:hypothetical protein
MQCTIAWYDLGYHCIIGVYCDTGVPIVTCLSVSFKTQVWPRRLWQVRFALSSSPTFSRTDRITDSEFFYASIIDLLEDPEEQAEVRQLLAWWDR